MRTHGAKNPPDPHIAMPSRRPSASPENGGFREILWVAVIAVVGGGVIAIAGETVYRDPALARLGTWITLAGGMVYAVFRVLAIRRARRRAGKRDT